MPNNKKNVKQYHQIIYFAIKTKQPLGNANDETEF
jgi:hypothetical protein